MIRFYVRLPGSQILSSTVQRNAFSRQELCLVGHQKGHEFGHFVGRPDASQTGRQGMGRGDRSLQKGLVSLGRQAAGQLQLRRNNDTGIDGIDANPVRGQIETGAPRQGIERRLGHAIRGHAGKTLLAIDRRDIDNGRVAKNGWVVLVVRLAIFFQVRNGVHHNLQRRLRIDAHVEVIIVQIDGSDGTAL